MTVSITSQKLQKTSCKHSIGKSILLNFANFVHDSSFFVRLWHETKKKKLLDHRPWLVGWLVKQFFSENALRIFLIFLHEKSQSRIFEKNSRFLIWRYSRKDLQIRPKSENLIFFSKTAQTIFLVFGLKLVLNMKLFFRKICNLEIFDLKIV